jgi:hypothetical protein
MRVIKTNVLDMSVIREPGICENWRKTFLALRFNNMQDAIDQLRFPAPWFEYGLLPDSFFEDQIQKLHSGQDSFWLSPEHHRYFAFQTILTEYASLSDQQIEQYMELCAIDEDQAMAKTALNNLLSCPALTPEQYAGIAQHPDFANFTAQNIIWQNRMRVAMQAPSIAASAFAEILARGDSVIEQELANAATISRQQLEVLAAKGGTKPIRNIAKTRLGW